MAGTRKFRSFSNSRMSSPMSIGLKSGNHVIKRDRAGIEYVRPSWNGTETIFRFLPLWNQGSQSWEPCRVSEDEGRYGAWQVCFEAVRNFGEPGITMLLCDGMDSSYEPYHQNPCWLLYRAIKDACDRKQGRSEWYPLLQKGQGRAASLSRPGEVLLCQALVFRHRSKNTFGPGRPPLGFDQPDPTVVVELSKSAAQAMFAELDRRNENYEGLDPNDPSSFQHPDITGLDAGAFVHFYQLGYDPREKTEEAQQGFDPYAAKGGHGLMQPRNKEDIGFGAFITETLDGTQKGIKASLKGHEKKIRQKVRPWEELLSFPSDEEQAHTLNKLFPASAIYYAFSDEHPEWILDETRDAALGKKRVNVPGGVPARAEQAAPESNADLSGGDIYGGSDGGGGADVTDDPFGPPDSADAEEPQNEAAPAEAPAKESAPDVAMPEQELPPAASQADDATSDKHADDGLLGQGDVNEAMQAMEKARARARGRQPTNAG